MTTYIFTKLAEVNLVYPGMTFSMSNVPAEFQFKQIEFKIKACNQEASFTETLEAIELMKDSLINVIFDDLYNHVCYLISEDRRALNSARNREDRNL